MDKLSDFLSKPDEVSGKGIPHTLTDGISVCDLSFAYENNRETLKHIDLNFQAGKNMRS